ncbi:hypothetical protein BH10BAC1_BH10BAC1_13560 [soil metagenome]
MNLILNNIKILEDFETERSKKMTSLCSDSSHSEEIFFSVLASYNRTEPEIKKALDYAKTLDFSKNHLKSSYLSHPLRLATILVQVCPNIHSDYIVIALLHNVPETTEITSKELNKLFGDKVGSGIEALVVDRKVNFSTVQESYYKAIFDAGESLTLVKLIDKVDNLFVLALNADNEVRADYITEIRVKLIPFALQYNQQLGIYLDYLLTANTELGFSQELKNQLTAYQETKK